LKKKYQESLKVLKMVEESKQKHHYVLRIHQRRRRQNAACNRATGQGFAASRGPELVPLFPRQLLATGDRFANVNAGGQTDAQLLLNFSRINIQFAQAAANSAILGTSILPLLKSGSRSSSAACLPLSVTSIFPITPAGPNFPDSLNRASKSYGNTRSACWAQINNGVPSSCLSVQDKALKSFMGPPSGTSSCILSHYSRANSLPQQREQVANVLQLMFQRAGARSIVPALSATKRERETSSSTSSKPWSNKIQRFR